MASRNSKSTVLSSFTKGLVTIRPTTELEPNEAAVADNVDLEHGLITRRPGWAKIHTANLPSGTTEPVRALYYYFKTNEADRLFAIAGTYLMKFEGSGPDFSSISSTFSPSGPARATFQAINNRVYIFSKYGTGLGTSQTIKKWSFDFGLETLAATQTGWLSQYFGSALWMAGDTTLTSRLYYSKQYPNVETWPALNFVDVTAGDGDKITGLGRFGHSLVVFKERSVHRMIGHPSDDAALEIGDLKLITTAEPNGCIAPLSVASSVDQVLYLGEKGIYTFDGTSSTELTKEIRPLFDNLETSVLRDAVGQWLIPDVHYVLSLQTKDATKPDLVISLKLSPNKSITLWKGLEVYSWANYPFSDISKSVLGTAGLVGKLDDSITTDNGKRIAWKYRTGVLPLGAKGQKTIRRGWVFFKPGGSLFYIKFLPDFQQELDGESVSQTEIDQGVVIAMGEIYARKTFPAMGTAGNWALEVSGDSDFRSPEISEVGFDWFLRGRP